MSAFAAASRGSRLATRRLLDFLEGGLVAAFEELLGRDGCKYMHGAGDDARPSRLVARAEAGPVVAVEVFVEQEIVAPVRVLLKLARSPVDRPPALAVPQEDAGQPARDLLGDLIEGHLPPGARGTFYGEIIPIVTVVLLQGPDDQAVDGHPDRPAPVGVAAEHAGIGLRGQIRDPVLLVSRPEHVGMLGV